MLEFLSSYRPFGKTILALEHTKQDTKPLVFGLELVQKKGELDIDQTFELDHPEEIDNIVKTTTPAYVVITDDQILSKEISQTGTDTEILAEAFPNLNLNDFYYQILRTSNTSFIAVCRKQYIETIIAAYQKTRIRVVGVHLGALKVITLSDFVKSDMVNTNTKQISYVDGDIVSMTDRSDTIREEYTIEGLNFSSTHTLPLAVALDEVLHSEKISGNIQNGNEELQKQYRESLFFTKTLQIGVGFLLIALLINFFVFNAKYKKWQGLQEELQVFTTQQEQIKNKQSDVNTKEALVQSILTTGFSKSSYYIDQMIQLLPNTVVLTSFTFQPLEKPIRKDKIIDLSTDVVSVIGKSTDKEEFTTWLRALEGLSFIESVTIVEYGLDKKNTSDFELTITIKSDGTTN
ncbi:PilN domain-containing protein [Aquimarina mytili]|uniref:Uncharacterized protein n=1 Tax=Aquimarina mytili TaxID=874423 RepID=A0A937D9Y9_9FLAO|nr:PilN domain-containing protein [Aquimarina mytili]MBL0684192.1 hypothetical protein [Aquimarina mytili]